MQVLFPILLLVAPAPQADPEAEVDPVADPAGEVEAAEAEAEAEVEAPEAEAEAEAEAEPEPEPEPEPAPAPTVVAARTPPALRPARVDASPRMSSFGLAAAVSAGWGLLGAGAGAWLYLREDSIAREDHSLLVTTQPAGLGLMIGGGALAVVGITAFAAEAIVVKRRRRTRVAAGPLPGGASLAVAGHF